MACELNVFLLLTQNRAANREKRRVNYKACKCKSQDPAQNMDTNHPDPHITLEYTIHPQSTVLFYFRYIEIVYKIRLGDKSKHILSLKG
jgi:hypothetical protein